MIYVSNASRSKRFVAAAAICGFAALLASPVMAKSKTVSTSSQDGSYSGDSDLRLALDKVQLDADSGKLDEAQNIVYKLKAKSPNNPNALAAQADLDDRMSS